MKLQTIILLAACALTVSAARAQEGLPRKVENVKLLDLEGNAAKLPYFGEKNLMIFYVDPDRHKQNEDFTIELEQNHRADSENIYGFGVMNLKDAPMIPNGMARNMARKRTEKNGATDAEHGMGAGRLQQQVRADVRKQGGRAGFPAQGRIVRSRQAGVLQGS